MNRPMYARTKATRRRKFAIAIASIFAFGSITQTAMACDFCDQGDGGIVCDSSCDSPCDSCSGIGTGKCCGPIFKTLDAVAGRLEKILGLKQCVACDSGCDSGCDASMVDDMMMSPMAPPAEGPYQVQPAVPSIPPESYSQPFESYSQPPIQHPYSEPSAPQRMPQDPIPAPVPNREVEGGLFDTLDNPFNDDEVRENPWKRSVQPSSYQKGSARLQPSRSISRYLNNVSAKTNSHQPPHRAATTQRSAGNSLKRAAARTTTAKVPTATRPIQHHHVNPHHAHQPAHAQVKLTQAPTPKQPVPSMRATMGQRHTMSTYGQSTQRPTADSYYRR